VIMITVRLTAVNCFAFI